MRLFYWRQSSSAALYCAGFLFLFVFVSLLLVSDGQKTEKEKLRERLAAFLKKKPEDDHGDGHRDDFKQGKKQGFRGWVKLDASKFKKRTKAPTTTTTTEAPTTTTTTTTTPRQTTTRRTTTRRTTTTATTTPRPTTTTTTATTRPTTYGTRTTTTTTRTTTTERPTTTTTTRRPTTTTTTTTTTTPPTTTARRVAPSNSIRPANGILNGWQHSSHNLRDSCDKYPKNHSMCREDSSDAVLQYEELTTSEKEAILKKHNDLRAQVKATNMQKMYWDDELALEARNWARQCDLWHEPNPLRNLEQYPVGQNIFFWYGYPRTIERFMWAVQFWYDEGQCYDFATQTCNPMCDKNRQVTQCGHYTQLVWAESTRMGCSYVRCGGGGYEHRLICNYAPTGNIVGKNPYKQGTKVSDCPSANDGKLCDCPKVCAHSGSLDLSDCSCKCKEVFHGKECMQRDCNRPEQWFCENQWNKYHCTYFINAPHECPHLCGLCPKS